MQHAEVFDQLKQYVARSILDGKDIGLDASTPLLEWGVINSLEIVRIVSFIRERFQVDVPESMVSAEHFQTLTSLTTLVMTLADPGAGAHL